MVRQLCNYRGTARIRINIRSNTCGYNIVWTNTSGKLSFARILKFFYLYDFSCRHPFWRHWYLELLITALTHVPCEVLYAQEDALTRYLNIKSAITSELVFVKAHLIDNTDENLTNFHRIRMKILSFFHFLENLITSCDTRYLSNSKFELLLGTNKLL